jgi:Spy/CpxP family protein refolding chaperone
MRSQAKRTALVAFLTTTVLIGAVACAARVDDKAAKDDITAQELRAHRGRHLHGPVNAVLRAAREHGNLTSTQAATLDAIAQDLSRDRADRKQLKERLKKSAVAIVRSGTTNSAEFDKSVGEALKAIEARMDLSESALEEIHATLRPDQRAAVAAALRARIEKKFGPRDDAKGRHQDGFKRVASHLMLSTLQIDKLKAVAKELHNEKKQLRPTRDELLALVDAFEGENFRSALNDFREKKRVILRERMRDAGKRTDSVLAIFTPEQRELVADLIVRGPRKVLLGQDAEVRHADISPPSTN